MGRLRTPPSWPLGLARRTDGADLWDLRSMNNSLRGDQRPPPARAGLTI
ncbi:MAG TPA: hypothetical protein VK359_09255 [Rubrobacteraceae bacterium]|nr:hypothetical protein [Rubrobacteraceae bacterium]